VVVPTFDNVDIYPLLARLTGVKPARTDGRLGSLKSMLAPKLYHCDIREIL
jgi:hypothetical protein